MIPGLAETFFAVLDGFRGAIADAGHAVSAVAAPDGLAVLDRDAVRRAEPGTMTAADAGVAGRKGICFDEERIEDRIHRAAQKAVVEVIAGRWECLICRNGGDSAVNVRLRPGNDLPLADAASAIFLRTLCIGLVPPVGLLVKIYSVTRRMCSAARYAFSALPQHSLP